MAKRLTAGTLAPVAAALMLSSVTEVSAQLQPSAQRALTFVRANCARCHAIGKVSPSPLAIAPPFRDLHKRYPVESLQEAFAEGIQTGHQNMPEFWLEADQIRDVIAI
jgi:cytochrome c